MAENNNVPEDKNAVGGITFSPPDTAQPESKKNSGLPRIRTYAADMSRTIKKRGETLSTIISSEKKKPPKSIETDAEKKAQRRALMFGVGAMLLIVFGIISVFGVVMFLDSRKNTPEITESIIFPNRTIDVEIGINDAREELETIRVETDMSLGEIARIIVTQNGVQLEPQEVAARLGFPNTLTREVDDIMLGIHSFDRNQPFVIMTISAFDRSFNSMLSSERDLGRILGSFFAPHNSSGVAPSLLFEDVIIKNIDVRQSGESWPIIYTYPQRTTLVVTTNEFTLREILTRLSNQQR